MKREIPWLEIVCASFILVLFLIFSARIVNGQDYDLPLEPPQLGTGPVRSAPPLPEEADGDDPRDTPPPVFFGEEIDAESDSILYVLDRSGSMSHMRRLARAKAEFVRSVTGLSENMRFHVVFYDCSVTPFPLGWREATADNKTTAILWASRIAAGGATGTGPAVAMGLSTDRENLTVVLLTDGAPNCGAPAVYQWLSATPGVSPAARDMQFNEAHRRMIRESNHQGAAISVFGIQAFGLYRSFCQSVALDSGGMYVDVP